MLLRFLIALPVGAVVGGWLTRRYGLGLITGAGLALAGAMFVLMAFWERDALDHWPATVVLLLCGFGFGLALSPVNTAMLGATRPTATDWSARWSWSPGWSACSSACPPSPRSDCAGTSRSSTTSRRPNELCPSRPGTCRPFVDALRDAAISQVHTIFAGAAVCAFLAAVLAVLLLGRRGAVHR